MSEIWFLVMNKPRRKYPQRLRFSKTFPLNEIRTAWSQDCRVIYLNYCLKGWILVTEKNQGLGNADQELILSETLPERDLQELWERGKRAHILVYGRTDNGMVWVLIGEEHGKEKLNQVLYYNVPSKSSPPIAQLKNAIAVANKDNKRLHTLSYSTREKIWGVIFEDIPKKTLYSLEEQTLFICDNFPEKELPRRLRERVSYHQHGDADVL